jgi:hypothetical protein
VSDRHIQNEDAQTGLVVSPILYRCLLRATMPRDERNQNSKLLFGQTYEVFGYLHLWVFNPKLVSVAVTWRDLAEITSTDVVV